MYAAHFGLSAPPFQLNPDPSFLYESKGHNYAHQYLRFGAMQGEGFIIVTGEIGAGKTTLVRALLNELDPTKVAAAQIVSTSWRPTTCCEPWPTPSVCPRKTHPRPNCSPPSKPTSPR